MCRASLAVLQSEEHAPTLAAIEMPPGWLTKWTAALDLSDECWNAVQKARAEKSGHVESARDAETDFVDVAVRFRKYIDARASYKDKAKLAEGKALLQPLTDMLAKRRRDEAARATRREQAEAGGTE